MAIGKLLKKLKKAAKKLVRITKKKDEQNPDTHQSQEFKERNKDKSGE